MNDERLTEELAWRVMGWVVVPHRFLTGKRGWMPRWRFRPATSLEDAFRLLDAAKPQRYSMGALGKGPFRVRVEIAGNTGQAQKTSRPRAVTYAVARALRLRVDE